MVGVSATSGNGPEPAPVFIACTARSGSTLLRWLLDAHPELACPGETDLAVLVQGYLRLASDLAGKRRDEAEVHARTRAMADELMQRYLVNTGKARWCDKSLSNVFHLELLATLWPSARFVLLHRHCMDMVMSGLEASPWGLSEYGFAQVAQMSPTDSVVALVAYWVDRTTRMLAFEQNFPDRCLRLRYEDLVERTDATLGELWSFLGVAADDISTSRAFSAGHSSLGPADHQIWYTDGIHTDSVGRGARVPSEHVKEPLRANLNSLLAALCYELVDDDWGRGDVEVCKVPTQLAKRNGIAELRILEGHKVVARAVVDLSRPTSTVQQEGTEQDLEPIGFVVAVEKSAVLPICLGTENLGAALRARKIRSYGRLPGNFRDEREVFQAVVSFLCASESRLFSQAGLVRP